MITQSIKSMRVIENTKSTVFIFRITQILNFGVIMDFRLPGRKLFDNVPT